jgi:hypothetical protein
MSGAASRRQSNRWELDVCDLLRKHGWSAQTSRAARGGTQHGNDIITDAPIDIEAKNQQRIDLAGWIDQALQQSTGRQPAALFIKRRQRPPEQSYVVMRADQFLYLLKRGDR